MTSEEWMRMTVAERQEAFHAAEAHRLRLTGEAREAFLERKRRARREVARNVLRQVSKRAE